jgi:hypothetical protein
LINNRQNGRRRGRGGAQVRGQGNGPDRGNRIDNRARGNAAQLHEKYKNLARDAQTQGDRVMTEYYLQFADHYFRVLNESRARFEEQNQNQNQRRRFDQDEFDGEGDDGEGADDGMDTEVAEQQQPQRREREPRDYRERREPREPREQRQPREQRERREPEPVAAEQGDLVDPAEAVTEQSPVEAAEAPRTRGRRGRPPKRREAEGEGQDEAPRIEVDRLPPSFSASAEEGSANGHAQGATDGEEVAEPAPKRRRTRKAASSEADVAA